MSAAASLLAALRVRAGKRRRVELAAIWQVFRDALPIEFADRGRVALAAHLQTLAGAGAIRCPKQHDLWDRSPEPPLPRWIELAGDRSRGEAIDHRTIPWPPELARLVDEPRIAADLLRELLAIKAFLAEGGRQRESVPLRERSVELFGDEKRLDSLMNAAIFRRVGITADLLRAFVVPVPIVWEPGPDDAQGDDLLVLENLHTYDSFRRWNAQVGAHQAVVYGGGKAFAGMLDDLARIAVDLGATEIQYFGDLDVEGLRIPDAAARVLRDRFITLAPAVPWYERLLAHGAGHDIAAPEALVDTRPLAWLPERLREPVRALLAAGKRLPQELVGWELLRHEPRPVSDGVAS